MKRILLIVNKNKDPNLILTSGIRNYICSVGGECDYFINEGSRHDAENIVKAGIPEKHYDCALVLGGDGTLVRASKNLAPYGIPLIGVNLGTLGYLCELERGTVLEAIDQIMKGEFGTENRMMLSGSSDATAETIHALNDIVIHRSGKTQIVRLSVAVNGKFLYEYDADGIIVAAPTGSTGYNLSVGGPIVDPKAHMILITPISPHDLNARTIVIDADARIDITLDRRRPESDETADVTYDGDSYLQMRVGDSIRVVRAEESVKILKLDDISFLQILSKKMKGYR